MAGSTQSVSGGANTRPQEAGFDLPSDSEVGRRDDACLENR